MILYSIKTNAAATRLANVPSKYLFLKSFSFKSAVRAQVLTVIIIAIAAKSPKYAKITTNNLSRIPIIDPTSKSPTETESGNVSSISLLIKIEQGAINSKTINATLMGVAYAEEIISKPAYLQIKYSTPECTTWSARNTTVTFVFLLAQQVIESTITCEATRKTMIASNVLIFVIGSSIKNGIT